MKYRWILAFCLLLPSCVSISEVVPAGQDTWMVGGGNSGIGRDAELQADLYRTANGFCVGQNKKFMPVSSNQVTLAFGRPGSAQLTFRCLLESDPEYQRPNMKPVPNTSVEVIQK
jgi:hypothetical protein